MSAKDEPRKPVKRRRKKDEGEDRLVKVEKTNAPLAARDPSGKWQRKVDELEARLGFPAKFLWHWFDQLAMCVEHEQKIERYLSEHAGYRLLRGMFDKVELGLEMN